MHAPRRPRVGLGSFHQAEGVAFVAVEAAPSDLQQLLARVALGERPAFEQLYRATAPRLLGLAQGIVRQRELAEEVLQDSFMKVWHGASGYEPALASPMTWLIGIVRHKAIDRLRQGRALGRHEVVVEDEALHQVADDGLAGPERQLEASLGRAQVDRCMSALTREQRQALALAYYRGLLHREIASALGAPLGSVKAWVRRGADRLRGCLQAAGVGTAGTT